MPTPSEPHARIRAFEALYRDEFDFVWAATRRLGVPFGSAEDAVQEVFLIAYRRLDQLRFEVSARGWLYAVARRIAARHHRSAARLSRRKAAVAATPRGPTEAPQDRLAAAEQIDRLLAGLGDRSRRAFEMAELLGMSGPEIAAELGIPVATVYSRVRLAREQLVRALSDAGLARGLAAARARDEPPPATAQRAWLALLPGLHGASAAGGVVALASVRTAVMTALIVAVGVVAVTWPKGQVDGTPRERAAPTETTAVVATPAAPREPPASETPPEPRAAPAPTSAPTQSAADRLAVEVALLDRARDELARGATDAARARLAEHGRRFPDGALVDLRRATEVELLCHAGDTAVAAAKAAELVAQYPRSAVARRFTNFSCPR